MAAAGFAAADFAAGVLAAAAFGTAAFSGVGFAVPGFAVGVVLVVRSRAAFAGGCTGRGSVAPSAIRRGTPWRTHIEAAIT